MLMSGGKWLLGAFAALALTAIAPAPAQAQPFAPARFSVDVRGDGPDVILIPGLASSRDVWAAQADALAATHRVHLVQVAGFAGEPSPASREAVLGPLVEELDRYIESYMQAPPAVIGHSMGGLTGLMLARAHPERVSKLMIVDALPFYGALFGPHVTPENIEPQARSVRDNIAGADDAAFAAVQASGVARLVRTPERRAEVAAWGTASDRVVFSQAMYEVMTTDMRPEVANVVTPITLVYAYDTSMGPEERVDGLFRGAYAPAPYVSFVRVDNSLHFIMLDQPEAFQAAVADFLR